MPGYVVWVKSEKQLRTGLLRQFYGQGFFGLLSVLSNPVYYRLPPWWLAGLAALYGLVWLTLWGIITSNALIDLLQRTNRASSLIDIELKRRYDLIDRLVQMVQALQTQERGLQEALARLRAEISANLSHPSCVPVGLAPTYRIGAEIYPHLIADTFL